MATNQCATKAMDWLVELEADRGAGAALEARKWAAQRFPYSVEGQTFSLGRLTQPDAGRFVRELRRRCLAIEPHVHVMAFTPDASAYECKVCGADGADLFD